jgi:hypothetical protein
LDPDYDPDDEEQVAQNYVPDYDVSKLYLFFALKFDIF